MKKVLLGLLLIDIVSAAPVIADEVHILSARVYRQGAQWQADVTLRHSDAGWDHYADRWRIYDPQGSVLGERILYHPHVDEQPFTRSLKGIAVPDRIRWVEIEAHDTVSGWASQRLRVNIDQH